MANIKSQKKRIKTNEKARLRNRAAKAEMKTAVRRVREAAEFSSAFSGFRIIVVPSLCAAFKPAVFLSQPPIISVRAPARKGGYSLAP